MKRNRRTVRVPKQAAPAATVTGRISVHQDGYGFVVPERTASTGAPRAEDIFVPPPAIGNAMHGDTVTVKVTRRHDDGRMEGRVVAVARRAHATVVGIFHRGPQSNFVQPLDDKLREIVVIPRGAERPRLSPNMNDHRVLGREVLQAATLPRIRDAQDLDGLVVDVEITEYSTGTADARGRVIEVLGKRDDFGVDVEIMIRKYHLPHRFPAQVLHEADAMPEAISPGQLAGRRDFRELPIITIDGETARDFDDAVLVRRQANGGFTLQVHIADVSAYVAPNSAIDLEARLRGTSVYFPDRAVPMLPAQLSTNLCSLRPGEDRLVVSCLMEIDEQGEVAFYELTRGVIRSAARLTYTQVNAWLQPQADSAAHSPMLREMASLQAVLYAKRMRRGSIDFDLPESEVDFDEMGLMRAIVKSERNIAHRIIEEFMLAAAETVARHLQTAMTAAGLHSVYRIHEKPELKKVAEFESIAAGFGYSLGTGPLPLKKMRERVNGRWREFEVAEGREFHISPRHYQRLAQKIAGTPVERILSYLMLRSLKQARYSTDNAGHFALATDAYTHFTSPIRRYPDLLVHRLVGALLDQAGQGGIVVLGTGKSKKQRDKHAPKGDFPSLPPEMTDGVRLEAMCRDASEAERRAADAERELMEWKKVRFMEGRWGETFPSLISHVTRHGFFVELTDLFIEGFVAVADLEGDRYRYLEASHEWVGEKSRKRYRLGDQIRVMLERIDPVRHKIYFTPE